MHYSYKLNVIKFRDNQIDENVTLVSTGLWKYLLTEICIHSCVCPPTVDVTYSMVQLGQKIIYSFDAMTAVVSLLRLYTVIRLFEHYSHWTNERSKRVCKINGAQANAFFALKAYLTLKPYVILTVGLVVSTFVLGFALRTFEIGLTDSNFEYAWNSFWVVILTMTTIGYGDIFPKTHLGRITCIVACIWGVFILSLFVVALTNTTEFTPKEEQVYEAIIMERAVRKKLKRDAGQIIKEFILLTYLRRKQLESKRRTKLLMGLIARSGRFNIKRLNVQQKEEDNDELLSQMQGQIDDSLKELKTGLDSMRVLFENAKKTQEEQHQFQKHVKRSHKLSVCLVNLATLLTEFGPIRPIKSMKEIESYFSLDSNTQYQLIESMHVLTAEELKDKILKKGDKEGNDMQRLMLKEIEDQQNPDEQEDSEDDDEDEEDDDSSDSNIRSEFSPVSPDRRR
eukprot:403345393